MKLHNNLCLSKISIFFCSNILKISLFLIYVEVFITTSTYTTMLRIVFKKICICLMFSNRIRLIKKKWKSKMLIIFFFYFLLQQKKKCPALENCLSIFSSDFFFPYMEKQFFYYSLLQKKKISTTLTTWMTSVGSNQISLPNFLITLTLDHGLRNFHQHSNP